MTFLETKKLAIRLFGPTTLHRGNNRCFVLRDGLVIGDGRSWLEALRTAGELQMAKNAMIEAEQKHVADMLAAFRVVNPSVPVDGQLSEEQLALFDAFVEEYEKTKPSPVPSPKQKSSSIPAIPKQVQVDKPMVMLK